jgi:excisionase family DNA binding protein
MPPKKKSETSAGVKTHVLGDEVLTTGQVACEFDISIRTVLRAIHSGKLKARRMGKQFLMTRAAVREFWESIPLVEGEETTKDA